MKKPRNPFALDAKQRSSAGPMKDRRSKRPKISDIEDYYEEISTDRTEEEEEITESDDSREDGGD